MAGEYSTSAQHNINWVQTWCMTAGAPAIAKRIFDTKAHAELFIKGDAQNNIDPDPSAIAGLVLRVVLDTAANNGIYSVVYKNVSQPSQGLELMRLIDEQNKVNVATGTTSLDVAANTYYKFQETLSALTISSVENSNLESDITFTAGSTGATITLGSGVEAIGSTSIPANAKVYMNLRNGVLAIYNDSMLKVDATFYPTGNNLATSHAIATWVEDRIAEVEAEIEQTYKADWNADPIDTQGILNKPNPLWTSPNPVPTNTIVTIYAPGQSTGCLHHDGEFREVRELPTEVTLSPDTGTTGDFTVTLGVNTIYKINDSINVNLVTISADNVNVANNTAETIMYFKTGASSGTIKVTGNNRPVILGSYDTTDDEGTLLANTRYVVNYKDGVLLITPTENFVTAVARETTSGNYSNIVLNGEAKIPLFKTVSETSSSGLVPAASKAKQVLTGNGWGNLFVSSRTGSDVVAGVFYWDNTNLYMCVDVTGTTATWVKFGSVTTDTTTIS